jgi:hypothetical protein
MIFNKTNTYKIITIVILFILFLIILGSSYIPEVNNIVNNIIDKVVFNFNNIYYDTLTNIEDYTPKVLG